MSSLDGSNDQYVQVAIDENIQEKLHLGGNNKKRLLKGSARAAAQCTPGESKILLSASVMILM